MRAIQMTGYGGSDVLALHDVPEPTPGPRDIVVAVRAASVNPIDWKIRRGIQSAVVRTPFPWTLGLDASGVVTAVGTEVSRFEVGDEVFTSPTHKRPGTYAEHIVVDQTEVAHKPTSITHSEAATIPLAGLTAWACLVEFGRVAEGQRVFISTGSGGVGSLGVQIAKHFGAHVTTTCSSRNEELVTSLGADAWVDYTTQRFEDVTDPVHLALDAQGGDETQRLVALTQSGGRVASINANLAKLVGRYGPYLGIVAAGLGIVSATVRARLFHGVRLKQIVRPCRGDLLQKIADLIDAGSIRPVVDKTFPLEDLQAAHDYSESGRARGKIVIEVS